MSDPRERTYRRRLSHTHLETFEVRVKETDLLVRGDRNLSEPARNAVLGLREQLESYIVLHPEFAESMVPVEDDPFAPRIVRDMMLAGKKAGVGPMAAVAGAVAEHVGKALLRSTDEIIVENGGDIFVKVNRPVTIGIYAGESPLSNKFGLTVEPGETPLGICTSSGTVGHSKSFGKADAACVVSVSTALADAAATALGNRVRRGEDLEKALSWSKTIDEVGGALIIIGEKIGAWGTLHLVRL